jgi:hypothetical protein
METLPFDDAVFDAAVSQFGFEYGRVDEAARELARVLAPGSPISFLIHHSESSVVSHNCARNRALGELTGVEIESAFRSGNVAALDQQLLSIMRQYPTEAIVGQLAQALRTHIVRGEAQRERIWGAVVDSLAPEREILAAMEASAETPERPTMAPVSARRVRDPFHVGDAQGDRGEGIAHCRRRRKAENAST